MINFCVLISIVYDMDMLLSILPTTLPCDLRSHL